MKTLILSSMVVAFAAGTASADLLYSQSFENTDWLGGKYYDTGDAATDHWLVNNAGEAAVNGDGFNAWYGNTRGSVGLTDGDYVGVTDYTGNGVGAYYDGSQGYQMSDTDGMMSLFFDDYGTVNFSVAIFIASTGYESDDSLSVMYGDTVIASYGELELEGSAGQWMLIEGSGTGQLSINFDSNSGSEAVFIDAVNIWTGAIPAPGALALLGLAGLASRRHRR
jgi:MYXO-CTERM domain-containing protein